MLRYVGGRGGEGRGLGGGGDGGGDGGDGDDGGGDGGDGGDEGGGGEGGSQASCSMLLTGLHPPPLPPHRTTQRWLPSEQVTLTVEPQPKAVHWKQTCWFVVHKSGEQLLEHGVSSTPAITYGVPRRSMTPSAMYGPREASVAIKLQSYAEPAT